eukprot:361280-Chlamydomonas_euryale.AAC.2
MPNANPSRFSTALGNFLPTHLGCQSQTSRSRSETFLKRPAATGAWILLTHGQAVSSALALCVGQGDAFIAVSSALALCVGQGDAFIAVSSAHALCAGQGDAFIARAPAIGIRAHQRFRV